MKCEKMKQDGVVEGIINDVDVDSVTYSSLVSPVIYKNAGYWNTTTYGIQFYRLALQFGAGPLSFI